MKPEANLTIFFSSWITQIPLTFWRCHWICAQLKLVTELNKGNSHANNAALYHNMGLIICIPPSYLHQLRRLLLRSFSPFVRQLFASEFFSYRPSKIYPALVFLHLLFPAHSRKNPQPNLRANFKVQKFENKFFFTCARAAVFMSKGCTWSRTITLSSIDLISNFRA